MFFLHAQKSTVTVNIQTNTTTDTTILPYMLGVISGPNPWSSNSTTSPWVTNLLKDIGVTTIRNNDYFDDRLDMEQIFYCGTLPITSATPNYPSWGCDANNNSNYNWTLSDQQMNIYQTNGFLPFLRLGNEYNNYLRTHDYNGPRSTEENNWIIAAKKVTNRYINFNGVNNNLGGYLNIWTEWPNTQFWDRTDAEFNSFWQRCYDSLKVTFPNLKIGGPGFHPVITSKIAAGTASPQLLGFLTQLKSKNIKPDWLGFHVFNNTVEEYYNVATNLRHYLNATGPYASLSTNWGGSGTNSFFYNVPIICDAWSAVDIEGGNTLSLAAQDSVFNKQKGGALNAGAFIVFQQGDVERAYKYRANDPEANPNASAANGYTGLGKQGLFYGDAANTYKPQSNAFKLCKTMQTSFTKKLTSPVYATTSSGAKLWTLASENNSAEKAVLLSNYSSDTVLLTLQINGINLSSSSFNYIRQYQVTNTDNGQNPTTWVSGSFTLLPFTANLITMTNVLAVNNTIEQMSFKTFPNPATNKVYFQFPSLVGNNYNLLIYNNLGAIVQSIKNINTKTIEVQTSSLSNGLYFFKLQQNGKQKSVGKFLIAQ